jgi:hypothetical protein
MDQHPRIRASASLSSLRLIKSGPSTPGNRTQKLPTSLINRHHTGMPDSNEPQQLKEYLKDLQLKDARHKQELNDAKRLNSKYKQQIAELQDRMSRLEHGKSLNQDFFSQYDSEILRNKDAKTTTSIMTSVHEQQNDLDNIQTQIKEIKKKQATELALFDKAQSFKEKIPESVNPNTQRLLELLKSQLHIYEEQLKQTDSACKTAESRYEQQLDSINRSIKEKREEIVESYKERVIDLTTILQNERKIAYSEASLELSSSLCSAAETAIKASENVLNRLKQKSGSNLLGVVKKLDNHVSKSKTRTINLF